MAFRPSGKHPLGVTKVIQGQLVGELEFATSSIHTKKIPGDFQGNLLAKKGSYLYLLVVVDFFPVYCRYVFKKKSSKRKLLNF